MILVIGKKDRKLVKNAAAYIESYSAYALGEKAIDDRQDRTAEQTIRYIVHDCKTVSRRLLRAVGSK